MNRKKELGRLETILEEMRALNRMSRTARVKLTALWNRKVKHHAPGRREATYINQVSSLLSDIVEEAARLNREAVPKLTDMFSEKDNEIHSGEEERESLDENELGNLLKQVSMEEKKARSLL
jgi:hypothetical protein